MPLSKTIVTSFIHRWIVDGIERGQIDVFDELVDAASAIDRSGPVDQIGSTSFKQRARGVHDAFGDITSSVSDLVIDREDSRIAWRFTLVGTHRASFMGIDVTGKRVTMRGMNIQRLQVSEQQIRVIEHVTMIDRLSIRDQLMG